MFRLFKKRKPPEPVITGEELFEALNGYLWTGADVLHVSEATERLLREHLATTLDKQAGELPCLIGGHFQSFSVRRADLPLGRFKLSWRDKPKEVLQWP